MLMSLFPLRVELTFWKQSVLFRADSVERRLGSSHAIMCGVKNQRVGLKFLFILLCGLEACPKQSKKKKKSLVFNLTGIIGLANPKRNKSIFVFIVQGLLARKEGVDRMLGQEIDERKNPGPTLYCLTTSMPVHFTTFPFLAL